MTLLVQRRNFLRGLGSVVIGSPAIVRYGSLMPVKVMPDADTLGWWYSYRHCHRKGSPWPQRYTSMTVVNININGVDVCFSEDWPDAA